MPPGKFHGEQELPGSVSGRGTQGLAGLAGNRRAAAETCKPPAGSDISAGVSPQGAAARSERCSGTRDMDSIIIKKNLFNLWV